MGILVILSLINTLEFVIMEMYYKSNQFDGLQIYQIKYSTSERVNKYHISGPT